MGHYDLPDEPYHTPTEPIVDLRALLREATDRNELLVAEINRLKNELEGAKAELTRLDSRAFLSYQDIASLSGSSGSITEGIWDGE